MEGKKNYKKIVIVLIVALSICVVKWMYIWINNIQEANEKIIRESKNISFDTKEEREESIKKLEQLLKEYKYIPTPKRVKIINQLSTMHLMNSNYEKGLEYSIEVIYLAGKCGDTFKQAKSLIDISNIFSELNQYGNAESIIKRALELKIEDKDKSNTIKQYGYINLADIYSKEHRNQESIEYVYKAIEYANPNSNTYEMDMLMSNLIIARVSFYEGNVEKCKEILKKFEEHKNKYENKLVSNIQIPYLALRAKVEIHDGNIEKGIKVAKEMFELCDREGLKDTKKRNMDYILEALHEHYDESDFREIDIYEHDMLEEYDEIIKDRNKIFAEFMIGRCSYKLREMEAREDKGKVAIQAFIIITMILLLGTLAVYARGYKRQTQIDSLTKVFNRRKFDYEYKRALLKEKEFGIIIIDIDHFKVINDNYGHAFGDVVLRQIAKSIKDRLSKNEKIFRYGGEEFCILCYNKELEDIIHSAESIRREVESMIWREKVKITISIGVACKGQNDDLFKLADENLYESKENGRNRTTYKE